MQNGEVFDWSKFFPLKREWFKGRGLNLTDIQSCQMKCICTSRLLEKQTGGRSHLALSLGRNMDFYIDKWKMGTTWIHTFYVRIIFLQFERRGCSFAGGYLAMDIFSTTLISLDIVPFVSPEGSSFQFVFFTISSFPSFSLSTLYVGNTLDIRLGSLSWCLGHIFLFACRPAQLYTP